MVYNCTPDPIKCISTYSFHKIEQIFFSSFKEIFNKEKTSTTATATKQTWNVEHIHWRTMPRVGTKILFHAFNILREMTKLTFDYYRQLNTDNFDKCPHALVKWLTRIADLTITMPFKWMQLIWTERFKIRANTQTTTKYTIFKCIVQQSWAYNMHAFFTVHIFRTSLFVYSIFEWYSFRFCRFDVNKEMYLYLITHTHIDTASIKSMYWFIVIFTKCDNKINA